MLPFKTKQKKRLNFSEFSVGKNKRVRENTYINMDLYKFNKHKTLICNLRLMYKDRFKNAEFARKRAFVFPCVLKK